MSDYATDVCASCHHPRHLHKHWGCNGVVHDEHGPRRWPCACHPFTNGDPQ